MKLGSRGALLVAAGAMFVCALGAIVAADQARAAAGSQAADRPPMAEEAFKDIQVLKGIPVDQFMGTMGFFSASTGLNCSDCHVAESGGDWARYADDTPLKATARRMMLMVAGINRSSFQGRQVVTCYSCHRGTDKPEVTPSMALLYGTPLPPEPGDTFTQAQGQPTPDQVFDKYLQALGGSDRLAARTSVVAKGTYMGYGDSDTSPVELFLKAPGQRTTIVHTPSGTSTTTYDGHSGWIAAPQVEKPLPLMAITGQELDGVKLEAELFFPLRVKQMLTSWRVGYPLTIGDREVQPVQGTTAAGGVETLCFDKETGLLVRLVRHTDSPVGHIVTLVDYSDYRDVAGTKLPYRWTVSWLDGRSEFELTDVQVNAPVDAAKFARPAPSATPQAPPANRR